MAVTPADADRLRQNVPAELQEQDRWLCWKEVPTPSRPKKMPINPHTLGAGSSTDPSTWCSFEEAIQTCLNHPELAGIGYVFVEDSGLVGIDLDDCVGADRRLEEWAEAVLEVFPTYAEYSPGGKGVKIWARGKLPGGGRRGPWRTGVVEMYATGRYFTVTGRALEDKPSEVADCHASVDGYYTMIFGEKKRGGATPPPPSAALADRERRCRAYLEKCPEAISGQGGHDATLRAACECYRFGLSDAAARETMIWFNANKTGGEPWNEKELEHKLASARKKVFDAGEFGVRLVGGSEGLDPRHGTGVQATAVATDSTSTRLTVLIDTDEHRVVTETIVGLTADPDLYQRGGVLARVLRGATHVDAVSRSEAAAVISMLPTANLRDRMTRWIYFRRAGKKDPEHEVPAHPPAWLVAAVDARGYWPGIRPLQGVSDAPVLRPDGSICQVPGYDPATGVLFDPSGPFPTIDPAVDIDDAQAALDLLYEPVCDFRFEAPEHRSAWLAGLLTPLARFAFAGPAPLFLVDANIPGAGKGLLTQIIGQVVLGHEMPVSSYAHDSEEMRKKITALAIAGDRMVLLDNLEGSFGNDALDRALTSTQWKDRVLGRSEQVDLPLIPVWFATGNNVAVAADTARRIIHIRLDVLEEKPEERTDFRHPNVLAWTREHRTQMLAAGLTLLSAYCRAGRPRQELPPFGSFEGWSGLVREALVWAGQPDPCLTRAGLTEFADTSRTVLAQLIAAWQQYDPNGRGVVVSELLASLYPDQREYAPRDEASVALRAALETLVNAHPGKPPAARQVGNRLRGFRRRVINGYYLDTCPDGGRHNGTVWQLYPARPSGGDGA